MESDREKTPCETMRTEALGGAHAIENERSFGSAKRYETPRNATSTSRESR